MRTTPTASPEPGRRRGHRRADAAGTGPASADGPEPTLPEPTLPGPALPGAQTAGDATPSRPAVSRGRAVTSAAGADRPEPADELGRWLLEQRPPHWG